MLYVGLVLATDHKFICSDLNVFLVRCFILFDNKDDYRNFKNDSFCKLLNLAWLTEGDPCIARF